MEYNNKCCISSTDLIISESNPNGILTRSNYKSLQKRKRFTIVRNGHGALPALIEFDSLPQKYRDAWIKLNGDPHKENIENAFLEAFRLDTNAVDFFKTFTHVYNDNEKHLSPERQDEYVLNASVLNAILSAGETANATRRLINMNRLTGFWNTAASVLDMFRSKDIKHTLPKNPRHLQRVASKYSKEGYRSLIHGNFMNDSSQKITPEAGSWAVAVFMNQIDRVTLEQLFVRYNEEAPTRGWKQLKSSVTIRDYLNRPEIKPIWYAARYGELAYKEKYCRQNRTKLPTRRDALWYGDGTKLNYYYQDEQGKIHTCCVYEVMDVFSECLLGYFISAKEDYEAQYNAYKMALQFAGHKPYEIRYDNQGGHKKLETGDFMNRLTRHAINTAPYNGKSKTNIESGFGRFQSQFLHKDWFFTGQNITAKKQESKANVEFQLANAHNLPTLDEIKETYRRRRDEWNAAPHFRTGIPHVEMYRNSINEGTQKVEPLDMLEIFGITTKETREYTASGIILEIKGEKHPYEVLTADGNPDADFNRRNIGRKLYRRYCPDDLTIIQLLEDSETGPRCIAIAQPYIMVNRALQDQTPEDVANIRYTEKMNKQQRIDAEVERAGILERNNLHPNQHGLEVAPIKGITSGRKQKKDIGQMLKDESNTTEMDMVKARQKSCRKDNREAVRKQLQQIEQGQESRLEFLRKKTDILKIELVTLN